MKQHLDLKEYKPTENELLVGFIISRLVGITLIVGIIYVYATQTA